MSDSKNKALDPLTNMEMPCSLESEAALLSAILIEPKVLLDVDSRLKSPDDFFLVRNKVIYTAMLRLKERKDEIDLVTLSEELSNMGELERIGGMSSIYKLLDVTGSSMHATVYADLISRTAMRRRWIAAADKMRRLAFDAKLNIDEIRAQADSEWMAVTSDVNRNRGEWIKDVVSRVYDQMENAMMSGSAISGLPTGLRDVDLAINGFGNGQLIIVAGRTGMGKSAAIDNIALHLARDYKIPLLYATSERNPDEVTRRMTAILSGVNGLKIESGRLSQQEAAAVTRIMGEISELPIYFLDDGEPRPRDVFAQADFLVKRHGCKIVLFDGMYRAKTGNSKIDGDDRTKYGTIALELKTMARTLNIPVVVTHQLNRNVENRADKRPQMSDLRESGRIEEEADKIILLYRDEYYNEATMFPGQCEWAIVKHRNGATGTISTYYEKTTTRFSDYHATTVNLLD
jgi:replicative DNA helicase